MRSRMSTSMMAVYNAYTCAVVNILICIKIDVTIKAAKENIIFNITSLNMVWYPVMREIKTYCSLFALEREGSSSDRCQEIYFDLLDIWRSPQ